MTVAELIGELSKFPTDLDVVMAQGEGEYSVDFVTLIDETRYHQAGWDFNGKPVKPEPWHAHWVELS